MSAERTFLTFFFIVIGYAVLSWLMMALAMKLAPKATLRLALGNLLIGIGVFLSTDRLQHSNWVVWNLADIIVLIGVMYYRASLNFLTLGSLKRLEPTLSAIAVVGVYVLIPPGYASVHWFSLAFSLTALYVFGMGVRDIHRWHQQDTIQTPVWWFSWPFWATALLFVWNLVVDIQTWSEPYEPASMVEQGIWWFYIVFVLLINSYMAMMGVYKLVHRMRFLAEHDSLTEALNHRQFKQQLERWGSRVDINCLSLIYLDLDNFKQINDTYGHTVGDQALIHAVNILRRHLRSGEIIGRLGGEEFAILLSKCDNQLATQVAESMRRDLEDNPLVIQGYSIVLTASFGVATAPSVMGPNYLLDTADHASYEAKSNGKNQVVCADLGVSTVPVS